MRAYGAELVLTDPGESSDGAIRICQGIYAENPETYFYPDQYNNPANWKAHYETTAPRSSSKQTGKSRISLQSWGPAARSRHNAGLRRELPGVRCISVQPASPMHGIEGTNTCRPRLNLNYDADLADDNVWVETEDAYEMARRLAREEGLLVGVSAAANVVAGGESSGPPDSSVR